MLALVNCAETGTITAVHEADYAEAINASMEANPVPAELFMNDYAIAFAEHVDCDYPRASITVTDADGQLLASIGQRVNMKKSGN